MEHALLDPPGLLAAGGDLRPERLLAAYRRGIFPWYSHDQPILWWSPDPRAVLFPEELRVSRSLRRSARNRGFVTRINSDFAGVMAACGDPLLRPEGTWITREMRQAYLQLHRLGHAHSVEIWLDEQLVGGLYGVQLGSVFFGESMFSRVSDASKVALLGLCQQPFARPVRLIDCQMTTDHLLSLGVRSIERREFQALLHQYLD
ncbi:leucyl/phenylalanyl-tRNA--protein transferase [Arenimonas sp.]|uniref:leucyl/phenylalanyl-tRNA--protein transferase n=1 Tax=Arenimonas sp. TaxID=1872635 RepID=UPI0039E589F3